PAERLHLDVLLEAGDAVLATDAAVLVATERHVGPVRRATVDAHHAGADAVGDLHPSLDRPRHDAAGEAVDAVVRDADGVVVVLERDHHEHGTEALLLRDRHRVVDV